LNLQILVNISLFHSFSPQEDEASHEERLINIRRIILSILLVLPNLSESLSSENILVLRLKLNLWLATSNVYKLKYKVGDEYG